MLPGVEGEARMYAAGGGGMQRPAAAPLAASPGNHTGVQQQQIVVQRRKKKGVAQVTQKKKSPLPKTWRLIKASTKKKGETVEKKNRFWLWTVPPVKDLRRAQVFWI